MNTNSNYLNVNTNQLSLSSSTSSSNNDSQVANTSPMNPNLVPYVITPTTTSTSFVGGSTTATTTTTNSTSSTNILNMKRSDSKGFNIFNVDILSLGKKGAKATKTNTKSKKKGSIDQTQQQTKRQTPDQSFIQAPQLDLIQINYSIKDNENQNINRTINSVHGLSSLDLFDQMRSNSTNGSDIDSEGYSIRPDAMKRTSLVKDNADLTNLYNSSSASNSDSDSEPEPGLGPTKVMLKIKPKEECEPHSDIQKTDLLREISKSLQLKPLQLSNQTTKPSKRNNCSFGMTEQSHDTGSSENLSMSKSISFAGISTNTTTIVDLNSSLKMPTVNENSNLYNIDEDKEVESSFQHIKRNSESTSSKTPVNSTNLSETLAVPPPLPPMPPPSSLASIAGRFTPACFPGKVLLF
jgi:hypothetical protein